MDSNLRPSVDGRAWVEIDLGALSHNAAEIHSHLPVGCELMAVVKSDAYGHGTVDCAIRLSREGYKVFAVATVVEGIRLRKSVPDSRILVLGYTHPKDAEFLSQYSLSQLVVDGEHARSLDEMGYALEVHIAVDTGMHRLGFRPDAISNIEDVFNSKNLKVCGMASHFAVSDSFSDEDMEFTKG